MIVDFLQLGDFKVFIFKILDHITTKMGKIKRQIHQILGKERFSVPNALAYGRGKKEIGV